MRITSPSPTPPWVIKVCFILMIFLPLSPPPAQIVNKITQKMVQILVQKWSKKSLKKVQLSKGRMVQSIFFFLRKVHYPNSSSFVLICFFVCFSCCFVCLLVMLHFSAFLPFPLYISSQLWSWLRQDAMVQEAIISGHDLGRLTHLPSIRPLLPPFPPQKQFWWTPSVG